MLLTSAFVYDWVQITGIYHTPSWFRMVLFLLLWECSYYWVHRLLHTRLFWPAHKWHHAFEDFWWLAGMRASVVHNLLFAISFWWFWILDVPEPWAFPFFVYIMVANNWMHLNLKPARWMRYMEWIFITPRYHQIHHSDSVLHYKYNLGFMLTCWDRWFGTYLNPGKVDHAAITYGIEDEVPVAHLVLGVGRLHPATLPTTPHKTE